MLAKYLAYSIRGPPARQYSQLIRSPTIHPNRVYRANFLETTLTLVYHRRFVHPDMTTPAGATPKGALTSTIATDHGEMYGYYDKFKQARSAGDQDAAERWARQLIWEIARHSVGEEIVVYPLMESHLGSQGKKMADEHRSDHQAVKDKLYKIDKARVGSEEYDTLLEETMNELRTHNDGEALNDLPLLESAISLDQSDSAARSFDRSKNFVPTRPHPSAPDRPPFETFAGFLAAPLDKLKDVFAKFPTEEMKEGFKS